VPAVVNELMKQGKIRENALTVNGKTIGENCRGKESQDWDVILPYDQPLVKEAGFLVLRGNLFDSAIMKTSVISEEFRQRYLSNPNDPNAFEGKCRRLRRAGGLSPPHRRSLARDRRIHAAVHARRRADRLSGRR
jgi:dihydroxyacid dehydratase/phosphogluconate dehydratase